MSNITLILDAIERGETKKADELLPLMRLSSRERSYEEDTATDRIIRGLPSTIRGLDSRTEYDINRPPELAIPLTPDMFWGVQVFHTLPTAGMNRRSLGKYEAFYRFMASCVRIILDRFGVCIVYDIHSYNIQRQEARGVESPPVFNLGTELLDREKWKMQIEGWLEWLGSIEIPGIRTTKAENMVFSGRGEFCRRLTGWDPNILVLPTEISKIYMDEREGTVYHAIVASLNKGLQRVIPEHVRSVFSA